VPVLTANVTALPEVVGDAALTADPHDPADIARALQRLVSEPALRQQLATAGIQQAARFNWRASAEALVASYRAYFTTHPV
jgi:glycosyltransferase involved in cell wall biosynthesis